MGTWAEGLLGNDCAFDGLEEIADGVIEDIRSLRRAESNSETVGRLAAAIGLLLELGASYDLSDNSKQSRDILEALRVHESAFRLQLPPEADQLLARVLAGEGEALAQRAAPLPEKIARALHAGSEPPSTFGPREPALFENPAAAVYVQEVADRCVAMIDEDFEDESNWSDLCREASGMGPLAFLLVLEPCRVDAQKIAGWRRAAKEGLAQLEAEPNDELDFQRSYHANLDLVFETLLGRFA